MDKYPGASKKISIHALREEGDRGRWRCGGNHIFISIHALREEGDPPKVYTLHIFHGISIHALREEGDRGWPRC